MEFVVEPLQQKKSKLKKVNVSGASTSKVVKAQKNLDDYSFLKWIDIFGRPKNTISNLSLLNEKDEDSRQAIDTTNTDTDKKFLLELLPLTNVQKLIFEKKRYKKNDICSEETPCLRECKLSKIENRNDPDEIFGKFVATELKAFAEERKCIIKHEINYVIFKHQTMIHYKDNLFKLDIVSGDSNALADVQQWRYQS